MRYLSFCGNTISLLYLLPRVLQRKKPLELGSLLGDTGATPLLSIKLFQLEPANSVHAGGNGEEEDGYYS